MPVCFAVPSITLPPIPGAPSLPASFPPNIPISTGELGLPCCFISIPAINVGDFLPSIPLPPGPVINATVLIAMEALLNSVLALYDSVTVPCPLQ